MKHCLYKKKNNISIKLWLVQNLNTPGMSISGQVTSKFNVLLTSTKFKRIGVEVLTTNKFKFLLQLFQYSCHHRSYYELKVLTVFMVQSFMSLSMSDIFQELLHTIYECVGYPCQKNCRSRWMLRVKTLILTSFQEEMFDEFKYLQTRKELQHLESKQNVRHIC